MPSRSCHVEDCIHFSQKIILIPLAKSSGDASPKKERRTMLHMWELPHCFDERHPRPHNKPARSTHLQPHRLLGQIPLVFRIICFINNVCRGVHKRRTGHLAALHVDSLFLVWCIATARIFKSKIHPMVKQTKSLYCRRENNTAAVSSKIQEERHLLWTMVVCNHSLCISFRWKTSFNISWFLDFR